MQVTEDYFTRATAEAAQNPAQSARASELCNGQVGRQQPRIPGEVEIAPEFAASQMAEAGLEPARGLPPTGF